MKNWFRGRLKKKDISVPNPNIEELKEAATFLEINPKIQFNPYPSYDGRIYTVLNSLGIDNMYMDNYEEIKDKPIEALSLEDLKTKYTFILRAERFCDGAIARYVEDGSLTKMVKREIELL